MLQVIIAYPVEPPPTLWPRALAETLAQRMARAPAVLVTGARGTGKSTLVRGVRGAATREHASLESLAELDRARRDAGRVTASPREQTIDEARRSPELLQAILESLEHDRRPCRYLLTSSTSPLHGSDALVTLGSVAEVLVLQPLTAREKRGDAEPLPWGELLTAHGAEDVLQRKRVARAVDWRALALEGGFPRAALARDQAARAAWLESHVSDCLERDLHDLAGIADLAGLGRLLRLVCTRAGGLLNAAELARDAGLSRTTTQRWLSLLVAAHLITRLEPFAESRGRRLIKLYVVDAGLGLHLAGIAGPEELSRLPQPGIWLEHLILNELLAWRETEEPKPAVLYRRTASGEEVDFVIAAGKRLLPIDVRATAAPRPQDARSLEAFTAELGRRAPFGLLLHEGEQAFQLAPCTVALPIGMVL